ncbi:MAG: fimbria major subunit [Muribaculaceae bacterium]|nr:fimbria major subunit [Muribaculaceae bacterium]
MKKTYAFALASAMLMLGGCSSQDEPLGYDPTPVDDEGTIGYLRIEFPSSATRAVSEVTPYDFENEIEEAAFIFDYADGSAPVTRYARKTPDPKDRAQWVEHDGQTGNKCAVVKLSKMPNAVTVVINGEREYEGDITAQDLDIDHYSRGTNNLFFMSSARYYDANGERTNKTPITGEMLFKKEEDAINAESGATYGKPVIVNVEHLVAKVKISNQYGADYTLDADGKLDPLAKQTDKEVNAKVTFKPEYTFLTGYRKNTYTIKKLPDYGSFNTDILGWEGFNSVENRWSGMLRRDRSTNIEWPTLTEIQDANKMPFGATSDVVEADGKLKDITTTAAKAYNKTTPLTFYAFDNGNPKDTRKTSVVVLGKYEVKDNAGNNLAAADGSFWLVAFQDHFQVYSSEKDAILAMGGDWTDDTHHDTLIPEDVLAAADVNIPGARDDKWSNWTGWMVVKEKSLPTRCVKYHGGYGYYSKAINHVPTSVSKDDYEMVVRNHYYDIKITGIGGMGIGLPGPNTPIVPLDGPDPKDSDYYLHMSVNVLPWRTLTNEMEWK